jgi:hypothetical protein
LLLAGLLVALFLWQSFSASLQKSPVFDEPPHIASGLSYLETRVFHANLQHPPLLKEMSALFLEMAGIHWPNSPDAQMVIRGGPLGEKREWPVGVDIIAANPDRVMFWARLPFILLAGLLGALIYWWGRDLVGSAAALGALFLYTFDPTVIAHSFLVTTDVGVTAFAVLFLFALWRYLHDPRRPRLILCGLAMGAVLGAKFSAVFLPPIAAILLLAAIRWPALEVVDTAEPETAGQGQRFAKVGANSLCPCGSGKKYKKCHGVPGTAKAAATSPARQRLITYAIAFAAMCGIAVVVIEVLYLFNDGPLLYLTGIEKVNADHIATYQAYLHGELGRRFYSYFLAAYLLKEPLASIALALAGIVMVLRSHSMAMVKKLFLLLTPAVFLLACTFLADDMGIRYMIPALPFTYFLGGLALASLFEKRWAWGRYAGAALCVWLVVEAVGIYPDHLSYFNESACLLESPGKIGLDGGSRCGPLWLDDSNVDWGQGVKQLRTWMERHGNGRTLKLAYFGVFPPEGYGLRFEKVEMGDIMVDPAPGLYAVSAHMVARFPAVGASVAPGAGVWMRRTAPVDIVGHAFYIYEVK